MKRELVINRLASILFWTFLLAFLSVCVYYMIHNAHWLIGDEAIVMDHTGKGRPFLPTGFEDVAKNYGRLYPFAYNLYDILLLFHSGYISPTHHYILHSVALVIFSLSFVAISFLILKKCQDVWKYAITLCVVIICVSRVYPEFVTCYTGVWIVFMFLPLFLFFTCKFEQTETWAFGIAALVVVNYINYCYETVFVVPLSLGACSLLFNYKKLSKKKRLFDWLLVGSGLLFLVLYAIIVLPQATNFYKHESSDSLFMNALKIFIAQKIYWIAILVLAIRIFEIIKQKSAYCFYDSLLLASFAYFCGAAVLKLNFTYYYNVGSLTALVAVLYFVKDWLRPYWVFVLALGLAVFYGRKLPSRIRENQKARIGTYQGVSYLCDCFGQEKILWYAPQSISPDSFDVMLRDCQRLRLEIYMSWVLRQDIQIQEASVFDQDEDAIWLFPSENETLFPDDTIAFGAGEYLFNVCGIKGYRWRSQE